jgi:3-hydroxyisobutyrate dehydrogenase-like beta-hydroxyacid dehydrogenase
VGSVAGSPADATGKADVVISMVTGPAALRDVYFGPAGVFEAAGGKTIVDMSTAGPRAAQELADAAELRGARLVVAPVLGSVPAVKSGTLVILAGARQIDDVAAAMPVLAQLGEVHYAGDIVSAAGLKVVANSMLAVVSAAAAELLAAGTLLGLEREEVFAVLARVAPGLKVREAGFLNGAHEPPMFAARDMVKDLELAMGLYQPAGGPAASVPFTELAREQFTGVASRTPDLDISAIVNHEEARQ